jgi:hypothetical protein
MQGFSEYHGPFFGEAPQFGDSLPASPVSGLILPNNPSERTWPRLLRRAQIVLLSSKNRNLPRPSVKPTASKLTMDEGTVQERQRVSSSLSSYTKTKDDGSAWAGLITYSHMNERHGRMITTIRCLLRMTLNFPMYQTEVVWNGDGFLGVAGVLMVSPMRVVQ